MNDFKGLSRATSWLKTPSEMWHFARNILLTSQYLSIANEKGNEYGYDIPGQVIGYMVTNEDIVYLSIDGSYSCIGYVNYLDEVYVPVVRTMNPNFKFKPSCPIEGVCMYNYKKELIIVFSDGINKNSSTPKLINLHKPQANLNAQHEFVDDDDYTMFELFSPVSLPTAYFQYEAGNLKAEVVHMAFSYVFEDDTESVISPILLTNYPSFKGINTIRHKIAYNLSNLSPNFKKIKLFFVINYDGAQNGYSTPILNIVNNEVDYSLATLDNLDIVAPEQILISSARFSKVKTITKVDNQMLVGNVEQSNIENYQIYANKLVLNLNCLLTIDDMEKYKSHPTLMPDEVYSVKIVPIYKDGTKGNALHIPGRQAVGNEREQLGSNDIKNLGLDFPEFLSKDYRRFHFENTGTLRPSGSTFGYWENVETYPQKDYYNSSSIGGEDLRGQPIRYHKLPTIEKTGYSFFATQWDIKCSGIITDEVGYAPKMYLTVANFEQAFPLSVRNLLQGYELVIEKRPLGGTYVETNGILYRMTNRWNDRAKTGIPLPSGGTFDYELTVPHQYPRCFSNSFFLSPETVRDNIDISATLVKTYYGVAKKTYLDVDGEPARWNEAATDRYDKPAPDLSYQKYGVIVKADYKLPNNIAANNRFNGNSLALKLKQKDPSKRDHIIYFNGQPIGIDNALAEADGYVDIDDFVPLANADFDLNIICASLITLNMNIYNLETANEFISLGVVLLNQANAPLVSGDVFTTNIINKLFTGVWRYDAEDLDLYLYNQLQFNIYNMYSPISNHYIENGKGLTPPYYLEYTAGMPPGARYATYVSWSTNHINKLNSFNYETVVRAKPVSSYFNTYVDALPPGLTERFVSYFPYRVHRGLDIPTESLQTTNLRFFPTNSYYDMPNDRGEIIALRGFNRGVFIQQRWSLYQSTVSDKFATEETEVYLGSSTLFDRTPTEVVDNNNIGYIGSNSQFACFVFRDGYVGVNEEAGEIFIVNAQTSEISKQNMGNDFRQVLPLGNHYIKKDILDKDTKTDNPFLSVGYIVGFDKENNRILVTKKYYNPRTLTRLMSFDGEFYRDDNGNILDFDNPSYFYNESRTFSFALDSKTWVCEHDYFPNAYLYNNKGFYGIVNNINRNAKFYKFNSNKVNPGNYFGVQYEAYVDLIFNTRLDISKQYQAVYWVSESKDIPNNQLLQFKTIDKIMVYNYHQCSGIIDVTNENFDVTRDKTARNTESQWKFNEFRDMLITPESKFLKDDGTYVSNSIAVNKIWFEKNMFIGNFVVTRLIWSNQDNRITYIHNVQVKSVNSNR